MGWFGKSKIEEYRLLDRQTPRGGLIFWVRSPDNAKDKSFIDRMITESMDRWPAGFLSEMALSEIGTDLKAQVVTLRDGHCELHIDLGPNTANSGSDQVTSTVAVTLYNRGNGHRLKGNVDRAIADYNAAIALDPKYAHAYNNRGGAYMAKGDLDRAMADLNQAIAIDPKYAEAYCNRSIAHQTKGEFDRAIADADQAIALDPKNAATYYNRGRVYQGRAQNHLKKTGANLDAFKAELKVNATLKGDLDRAITDYNQAITLNPKDARALYWRGAIKCSMGDVAHGNADIARAQQLNPNVGK